MLFSLLGYSCPRLLIYPICLCKPDHLTKLRHRHMYKPTLVDMALQQIYMKRPITIMDNLVRNDLPDTRPWDPQDALNAIQQAKIIPDVEIARLEDELQLVGFAAHDLLEALVGEASFLVVVVQG